MRTQRTDLRSATEAVLVTLAARTRDRGAFEELVRRREGWLRTLLRRLCGNPHEADDLAQETFLRAWSHLEKLRDAQAFGSWLRRLAVHRFIDARRAYQPAMDDPTNLDQLETAEAPPDRTVAAQLDLERALALLSPAERICIVLNLGEGLSHAEIAQATGLALGTIKSHILRGTTKLRHVVGAEHE